MAVIWGCAGHKLGVKLCSDRPYVQHSRSRTVSCRSAHEPITSDSRRGILGAGAALWAYSLFALSPEQSIALPAGKAQTPSVGTYLPSYGVDDFVEFVPDKQKTPAIRAGTVDPDDPYRFALPPSWREFKVANIQSGNYCQPRCAEPWTEVIFADEAEGKAQVIVSPLVRLTNRAEAKLEEIGPPEGLIQSLGAFITGTYLDEEDVVSSKVTSHDGRTYYDYEVYATYGTVGPHTLTSVTTKGDLALLFILSATDKQWAKSEGKLRKLLTTFRAGSAK